MGEHNLTPIYTPTNCVVSAPLRWGVSVFWREPNDEDTWLNDLASATEPDGIRVLGHRFVSPTTSQFVISTTPDVPPVKIVQRVKGRLQHLIRDRRPKAFRGNYAIRSFGKVTRSVVENYVASQLDHHPMADPRVQQRFERLQFEESRVDLSCVQKTSHGIYWYNLHIVLVHRERWFELREDVQTRVREMIVKSSAAKSCRLSRAGILPDHVHLTVGCPIEVSPADVALGYLNNLAYVHGMKAVYQYGAFIGTFGEYDQRAVVSETSPDGDKPHRGGAGESGSPSGG